LTQVLDTLDTQLRDAMQHIRDDAREKNRDGQTKAVLAPPPAAGPFPLTKPIEGKVLEFVTKAVGGTGKPRFAKIKKALEDKVGSQPQITVAQMEAELDKLLDQDQANADTALRDTWKTAGKKGVEEDLVKDNGLASAVNLPLDVGNPDLDKLV